jgi:hypothetical protein
MTKRTFLAIAPVAAALTLAACGGSSTSSNAPRQRLDITTKDFALNVNPGADVRPGQIDISALNQGKQPHGLLLGRINDGVKAADVKQLIATDPSKALTMFSLAGGISALSTGGTAWKATTTVRSGTYIVVDTGTGKDGKANFTKPGEVQTFTVSGNARPAAEAKSDATVTLRDYAIGMPSTISAKAALRVHNGGRDNHELTFVKVANAKAGAGFVNLIRSGKPVQFKSPTLSALAPTGPGTDTTIHVNLPPGQYLAYCSFASARSKGKAHAVLGMVRQVRVTG